MFKFLSSIWLVSILIPLPPTFMSDLLKVGRFITIFIYHGVWNKYCFVLVADMFASLFGRMELREVQLMIWDTTWSSLPSATSSP